MRDNIKMNLKKIWVGRGCIHLAENRVQRRAHLITGMKLRVPLKRGMLRMLAKVPTFLACVPEMPSSNLGRDINILTETHSDFTRSL
jgi:hypothetical protein